MKNKGWQALNFILFILITYWAAILQMGLFPLPDWSFLSASSFALSWIPALTYLSLYRTPIRALFSIYLLFFSLNHLSPQPLGFLLLSGILTGVFCQSVKSRVFAQGARYFLALTALSVVVFEVSQFFLVLIFDGFFSSWKDFLNLIAQAIITPLLAWPLYYVFGWIDQFTQVVPLTELREEVI